MAQSETYRIIKNEHQSKHVRAIKTKPIHSDGENGGKQVQNPDFIGPRYEFDRNQPKNVVGANFGIYSPHVSQKSGRLVDQATKALDAHAIYHINGVVFWALGPRAKHEIVRGQWGRELKDVNLQELLKLLKNTFMPTRNIFHRRAHFFNVKQEEEEEETLDKYWKRLVDIERKCEFNRITLEILSYVTLPPQLLTKKPVTNSSKGH